jgi:hypothetical protein
MAVVLSSLLATVSPWPVLGVAQHADSRLSDLIACFTAYSRTARPSLLAHKPIARHSLLPAKRKPDEFPASPARRELMSDHIKRLESWKVKYNTERVKQTLDELRPNMLTRYEATLAQLVAMEEKTKQVLNECGVHTILYVPYLNYSRQLLKLTRQSISGESAKKAAQVLLDKWRERGLDPDVLAAIRFGVYSITAP